jgi:hypothetical protein
MVGDVDFLAIEAGREWKSQQKELQQQHHDDDDNYTTMNLDSFHRHLDSVQLQYLLLSKSKGSSKIINHFIHALYLLLTSSWNRRTKHCAAKSACRKKDGQSSAITGQHVQLQCFMIIAKLSYVTFKSYRLNSCSSME